MVSHSNSFGWDILEDDVVAWVMDFEKNSTFVRGSNSTFLISDPPSHFEGLPAMIGCQYDDCDQSWISRDYKES